ncbi:MAG: hypothetical protein FJ104_03600 [Deltaproteobacteria bacterium]|nr:hypothetical protein [Deltaproteobacteria bacterium]
MPRTLLSRALLHPLLRALPLALLLPGCGDPEATGDFTAEQAGFEEIVYAVRQHTVEAGDDVSITVADGMEQVMDYGKYVPGARIEVRDLRTSAVRNLLEGAR